MGSGSSGSRHIRQGARAWRILGWMAIIAAAQLGALSKPALGSPMGPPESTAAPSISGLAKPGQTLIAAPGAWSEEPTEFKFRWELCDSQGSQCTIRRDFGPDASYLVQPSDALGYLRVQVKAANGFGPGVRAVSALQKVELAWEWVDGAPKVEVASRWSGEPCCVKGAQSASKTLGVRVSTGYCVGEPAPTLDHIRVIERPVTAARPFKSALVAVFIRRPQPTEVVGTVNPGEPQPGCAGLGYGFSARVKLKRPVERLFILDGGRRPYRLIRRPGREASDASQARP